MKKIIIALILVCIALGTMAGCQVFKTAEDRAATVGELTVQADEIAEARAEAVRIAGLQGVADAKIAIMEAKMQAEEDAKRAEAERAANTPTSKEAFGAVWGIVKEALPPGTGELITFLVGSDMFRRRGKKKLGLVVESIHVASEGGGPPDMKLAAQFQKENGVQGDVDAALSAIAKKNVG